MAHWGGGCCSKRLRHDFSLIVLFCLSNKQLYSYVYLTKLFLLVTLLWSGGQKKEDAIQKIQLDSQKHKNDTTVELINSKNPV